MSNFHTTLFQNIFVLVSWSTIILVTLWSIINISLIFLFLFVIIFTSAIFFIEFAGFEISFHVVYMWTPHKHSDWSNWPIKSHVGIWYALTCKQHGSWFRLPRPLIIEDPTVTDSSVPFTFLCLSQAWISSHMSRSFLCSASQDERWLFAPVDIGGIVDHCLISFVSSYFDNCLQVKFRKEKLFFFIPPPPPYHQHEKFPKCTIT